MASRKDKAPSVTTFADHEVITPPHELRKALANAANQDDDPVARAEAALAQLSGEFVDWMHAECERLEVARRQVASLGFTKETQDELFRAAHDIKAKPRLRLPGRRRRGQEPMPPHRTHARRDPYPARARRAACRCRAGHRARVCPARPGSHRQLPDPTAERGYRRIPARRERRPAGLPGKHFCAWQLARLGRLGLIFEAFGYEFVAEHPCLFARGLGGKTAQQREQRRQFAEILVFTTS